MTTKSQRARKRSVSRLPGTSKYICTNYELRCLNMGTDEGRECNFGQYCKWRRLRAANPQPSENMKRKQKPDPYPYKFKCERCHTVHRKSGYCITQQAMGNAVFFTCPKCGTKQEVP